MSVSVVVWMGHAPVLAPGLSVPESAACARSRDAMAAACARVVGHEPHVVVVVGASGPRRGRHWSVVHSPIEGDFSALGGPEVRVSLAPAGDAARALVEAVGSAAPIALAAPGPLDPRALTPAAHLSAAGWAGPTMHIAVPRAPTGAAEVGAAITRAAARRDERWAVVVAGNLSHRLSDRAPAGFSPNGARFDQHVRRAVRSGDLDAVRAVPADWAEEAAEDCMAAFAVGLAAAGKRRAGTELLAYEGPFGVGYLTAILHDAERGLPSVLPALARAVIGWQLGLGPQPRAPELPRAFTRPAGVYVSLYRREDGTLRASAGRHEPRWDTLADEVADVARRAATQDPRMGPLRPDELESLVVEVTVLGPLEPVDDVDRINPKIHGVLVSTDQRTGLLLPDLPGLVRPSDQIAIALRKAGISPREPYVVHRFTALRIDDST